ncbi:MAG: DUF393 domain-containing protein [Alphaproteobacteria bacterium]|nr:DUF393 domain-containing protein [Alphaproteobacteria bacterium]
MDEKYDITTFYNGACPICGAEINHYKRISDGQGARLGWRDISADRAALAARGVTGDAILKRLHVLDAEGRLLVGVDAFIALWSAMPRYRWLGRLAALPGIKQIAGLIYDGILAPALFAWNRRKGRI